MPNSMTGFARIEKEFPEGKIMCEVRSLNSRYLEMNIRLPRTDYAAEQKLRDLVKKNIKRGKIDITVKWEKSYRRGHDTEDKRKYRPAIRGRWRGTSKNNTGSQGDLTVDNVFGLKDVFVYEENHTLSEDDPDGNMREPS